MRPNPIDSGYCTARPLCTEFLDQGQGVQILHLLVLRSMVQPW